MTSADAAPAIPPYRPLVVASRFSQRHYIRVLAARLIVQDRGTVTCGDWRQVSLGPVFQRFGIRQMELQVGEKKWTVDSFTFPYFDTLRRAIQERVRTTRWAAMRALHLIEHGEANESVIEMTPLAMDECVRVA